MTTQQLSIIAFVMEDVTDVRRRLQYADYLEDIGQTKAAQRQRELVVMLENMLKGTIRKDLLPFYITTQNNKRVCVFLRKNGCFVIKHSYPRKMLIEQGLKVNRSKQNKRQNRSKYQIRKKRRQWEETDLETLGVE